MRASHTAEHTPTPWTRQHPNTKEEHVTSLPAPSRGLLDGRRIPSDGLLHGITTRGSVC
jgi:hypothetical protein